MSVHRLRFADRHIQRILDGEKTSTGRLDMEEDEVNPSDTLVLCTEAGDEIGTASVKMVGYHDLAWFAETAGSEPYPGHREYRSIEHCVVTFEDYYPDREVAADTQLVGIGWKSFTPADEVPRSRAAWRDGRSEDLRPDGGTRETHIDDRDGLFVPSDLREFDQQVVFRTPRATIQHFGSQPLDAYYGMIDASHFGDPDQMRSAKNPDLAPDVLTIKRQGEEPVRFTVDTDPDIRCDGGTEKQLTRLDCPSCDDVADARYLGTTSTDEHDGHIVGWECIDCGAELQEHVDSRGRSFDLRLVEEHGVGDDNVGVPQ
ncbi:ASCH domain-containing protein [Haloarculaceae archaeon H-GB2-1]|nr:ASCH domain-containing protein [Haloarculaceae archaeon H-GB1-1]MEA5408593.1 ASCH domain-containing protein [Haloarculaceae archaeon H-GB2-1]